MTSVRAPRRACRSVNARKWFVCGLQLTLVAVVATLGTAPSAIAAMRSATSPRRSRRVLIVSMPTLTWSDISRNDTPNLLRFLDTAAIADLATRADRQPAKLGAAYITIGAGTRAAGDDSTDGEGLATTERFGNDLAGQVYRQRTGAAPGDGIVDLGIARVDSANANLLYDAQPGALGDALDQARYSRSVIANGDGSQPDTSGGSTPLYVRSAVGALIGSDGRVPHGAVDRQLLTRDSSAPFGVRLDRSAVEHAFLAVWQGRAVALVEASDLVRADRSSAYASAEGQARQRHAAIVASDRLFARLLAHVDLSRDSVLIVAPAPRSGDRSVTIAGLRGPGIHPGLLRSATTRRSGFVTLADVAPTVLGLLAIPAPASMEGRPIRVDAGHGSASDRRSMLERANSDGLLRDDLVNPVTATAIWTAIALSAAAALLLVRFPSIRTILQWLAIALIGFMLATLPATLFHFGEHGGKPAYWVFVTLFALVFAAVCRLTRRRGSLDPLLWSVALFLTVLVVDQFLGAHLEFNSVFGYSATVGIRFAGIGNQSSALLAASAVIVASLLAWRLSAPRGRRMAVLVLVVSFVALTPPLFGQDFGGTLAAAPAFALLAWLLYGRRITVAAVSALLGILLASGLVVGFLDLLRPADQRTHVGRFFEKVGNEGFSGFSTVIERKGGENAATFSSPIYLLLIVVVVAAGVVLWRRPPRLLADATERTPTLRPAAWSLTVLAILSYGLNDSGLAIPAIMLSLVAAAGTYLVAEEAVGETGAESIRTTDVETAIEAPSSAVPPGRPV